jgi:hypothetical protein
MNITLIKTNGQGWEFPCENNWPCTVAFALGDPPNPVTKEEADRQAKLIAAAPEMLDALCLALTCLDAAADGRLEDVKDEIGGTANIVDEVITKATE